MAIVMIVRTDGIVTTTEQYSPIIYCQISLAKIFQLAEDLLYDKAVSLAV